ncbi:MAG: response regulator transcription factor [Chthoniobacterales bacterium]
MNLASDESITEMDPDTNEQAQSAPETTSNLRVLLIEDSMPVRGRIRSMIEEIGGMEIVGAASSVVEALALFIEHRPDAVVLDLYLKGGNAFAVLTEFKRSHPACVVIVLTNFATLETRQHCLKLGADYFFEKNQEFERVPEVLAELYRSRSETR